MTRLARSKRIGVAAEWLFNVATCNPQRFITVIRVDGRTTVVLQHHSGSALASVTRRSSLCPRPPQYFTPVADCIEEVLDPVSVFMQHQTQRMDIVSITLGYARMPQRCNMAQTHTVLVLRDLVIYHRFRKTSALKQ
jgi:hypothetical protein